MSVPVRSLRLPVVVAVAAGLLASCTAAPPTRAGGNAEPRALNAGTYRPLGNVAGDLLDHLRSAVATRSHGALTLSVQPVPATPEGDASSKLLDQIINGRLDAGVVAARVFDLAGVTSLQALQAPLRFTSVEQADALVSDPIADRMLQPLRTIGVLPLSLAFDGLRTVKGYGGPMTKPENFAGRSVSFPASALSRSTYAALGALENTAVGLAFEEAIAAKEVDGLDDSIQEPNGQGAGSVVGNEFMSFKADVIVVNSAVWRGLSSDQQKALHAAALDTRDFSITALTQHRTLDRAAEVFCSSGAGDVVIASAADVAAMRAAVAPVITSLRGDPLSSEVIDRIDRIGASLLHTRTAASCERAADSGTGWQPLAAEGDQSRLDGTWRFIVRPAPLLASGSSTADAHNNTGVWTAIWAGRSFTLTQEGESPCRAESRIREDRVSIIWQGTCGPGGFTARFDRAGNSLTLTRTVAGTEPDSRFMDAFFSTGLRLIASGP